MTTAPHGTIRVVIADDHDLFREGLAELIVSDRRIEVVAQAADGAEVLKAAREYRPDVVLLDVQMPGPGVERLTRQLTSDPGAGVVVLTMHDDARLLADVVAAGARGYLLKSATREELVCAVAQAARPGDSVLIDLPRPTVLALARVSSQTLLSARETEVLHRVDEAKSNRTIAAELHISDATVKRHLTNIYEKLGASGRLDAVRRARSAGLLGARFDS